MDEFDSFRIIDGLNPFHIILNSKELYIYIKNLSPAYFSNPDVWRVQLPKKEEFDSIKEGKIDFVLLGYDADNDVYTTWHPKWTKQRLNNGKSVSFYSRLSLQAEAASSQDIKRLSLNNDGEVIAFPREHLELILSNLKTFFQDDSDYVAMGSKRRPEANDAYKTFCNTKNVEIMARRMREDGYSEITIGNYCRAIKMLINKGYIAQHKKVFLSCDSLDEYSGIISVFCNQTDIKEQNTKWHDTLSAALKAYIDILTKSVTDNETIERSTNTSYAAGSQNHTHMTTTERLNDCISDIRPEDADCDYLFTDTNGKLTKITNPQLLDNLKPHLDSEFPQPIRAYNEIQDFYGDRYSMMEMSDWMNLFKDIDWNSPYTNLGYQKKNETATKSKSTAEILRVKYPNGTIIQHAKAVDTFLEVIENSYPDLIHELNIRHANVNLVTKERSKQYSSVQKEISNGWLVFTNINTRKKREDLLKISEELELGLKVDIISKATGEVITIEDKPNTSNQLDKKNTSNIQ